MTHVHRLGAVGAGLALAALFTAALRGGPGKGDRKDDLDRPLKKADVEENLANTKFADRPVIVYSNREGKSLFGWQVKPRIEADANRLPRDLLLLVDTSASQNRGPLDNARRITEATLKALGDEDRAAVWTVNVEPKKLTQTFHGKAANKFAGVNEALKKEYPSGATNLKKALTEAIKSFDIEAGRQRAIVFMGDGLSVAGPLDADDLASLSADMVKNQIAFYSVPLGTRLDPLTLHGFATATGGALVRMSRDREAETLVKDLDAALKVPVLYPETVRYSNAIAEAFPTRMPPLRSDAPTLVVGELKPGAERVGVTVVGQVAGREVRIDVAELVPTDESDNFFLAGMIDQWREAKDRPALLKADRALTFVWEQMQIAKTELLAQAEWALEKNELEAAVQLYEQALKLDHSDVDAKAGKNIIKQIKEGKLTRAELRKLIQPKADDVVIRIDGKVRKGKVDRKGLLALAQEKDREKAEDLQEKKKGEDLLNQVKQRQTVEDQRNTDLVREAVTEAGRLLRTNPDAAIDMLKRVRAGIEDNPDITDRARRALADRLQDEVRNLSVRGDEIRRTLAERAQALAIARERLGHQAEQQAAEDRIKERMRAINQLMTKARLEIVTSGDYPNRLVAIRAAEKLKLDLQTEGKPIPPALNAAYGVAQADFHLQEFRELRRQREQRFLLSMLQIERRHMPFPDEPPIEFPPASQWLALTKSRKAKYETFRFLGGGSNKGLKRVLDTMNQVHPEFPEVPADPQTKLGSMLNALSTKYSRAGDTPPFYLTFEINQAAFAAEGINEPQEAAIVQEKPLPKMINITLSTYVRRILERVPVPSGATFVIRKEADLPIIVPQFNERDLPPPPNYVVEITTGQAAVRHKETVAYSVSDLVVPIPNSINQQAVNQQATLFGQFGAQGGQFGQFGQGGQFGQFGQLGQLGQLGALGALGGGQLGALGALGALGGGALGALGGGALGALGGGALGALGGALAGGAVGAGGGVLGGGQAGVQGGLNFGVGGGQLGQFGGQLGQFGNLGGQFGLQGGTQEGILMRIIVQTVGTPRDWQGLDPGLAGPGQIPGGGPGEPPAGADNPLADPFTGNQLGYFPSALALVVKGSSLIHSRSSRVSIGGMAPPGPPAGAAGAAGAAGMLPRDRGDVIVIGGDPKRNLPFVGKAPVVKKPERIPFKSDADPRVVWQQALEKGIDDPGMIVATADFLMLLGKFDHAAEMLKANLRQGIVVRPWVYETLSICLKATNASSEEIERAEVALADLEPSDAEGFLKASQAMAGMKRYDRAIAFCRQAALLAPSAPQSYSDALGYAELAKDARAMEWAAGNLLKQEWPRRNGDLHGKAVLKVDALSKELTGDRTQEAERLKAVTQKQQQRDLTIRLSWVGQTDLDLKVQEPSGSVCSALNRQTPGGGTFMGDTLAEKNVETYVAAQAFPGKYVITVDRVWGNTATGKAQVQVIHHKGTDRESSKFYTVDLKENNKLELDLATGRRTESAAVSPRGLQQTSDELEQGTSMDELFSRLRDLADPELAGISRGFRGGAGSPSVLPTESAAAEIKGKLDRETLKSRRDVLGTQFAPVVSNVQSNVGFTAQATVTGDRRFMRVSLNPVFSNVSSASRPTQGVAIPVIPGLGGGGAGIIR